MVKPTAEADQEEAKASRLKTLRHMAGLTAKQLAEKYDFSLDTLKSWEATSRKGSISHKGAHKIANAMQQEGIAVTPEWILYGQGGRPYYLSADKTKISIESVERYQTQLDQETSAFHENYKDAVIMRVTDDAMTPFCDAGDIIGGIWLKRAGFSQLHQKPCIIEHNNQQLLCRRLIKISDDHYNCVVINPEAMTSPLIIENTKIARAAPVIRVWKKWS